MIYIGGGVMLYTRHEDKNPAHCEAWRAFTPRKKGKTNSIVVVLWCFCCAVVLLFVPFLANQKQRSQAQLAVGKPACWWLLSRMTESAVEKAQRKFVSGYVGTAERHRKGTAIQQKDIAVNTKDRVHAGTVGRVL